MSINPVGKYSGGRYVPHVHDAKALIGYDELSDAFFFIATDSDGALLVRGQVVDVETLEWVNEVGGSGSPPTSRYVISDISDPYYGYLDAAGSWYIMKLEAGEARYAKGASGYAAAWADKEGQDYGLADVTF